MVGRRSFRLQARRLGAGGVIGLALVLGGSTQAQADSGQRLVMVEHSPFMIQQLESKGYDVGFIGERTEAAVYLDDAERGAACAPRASRSARVEDDEDAARAQRRDRRGPPRARRSPPRSPRNGLSKAAKAKGAVNVPGNVVIHARLHVHQLRGALPLRRGAQRPARRHDRPGDVVHLHGPERHVRRSINLCNSHQPRRRRLADRRQQDLRRRRRRGRAVHVPPRSDRAARRGRHPAASQVTVRVADANGNFDTSGVTDGPARPSRRASTDFQKNFITKYMDATET